MRFKRHGLPLAPASSVQGRRNGLSGFASTSPRDVAKGRKSLEPIVLKIRMHFSLPFMRSCFAVSFFLVGLSSFAWAQASMNLKDRIATAREQRNEAEIERLVIECETRLTRGESRAELLDALRQITSAVPLWHWRDLRKRIELPPRIALFVLEKFSGESSLEAEVGYVAILSQSPHPRDPNLEKLLAERRHRLSLIVPVLHRLLAKIDPSIELLDANTFAAVPSPVTRPSGRFSEAVVGLEDIEDPALRAEFERRFRERELETHRKSEQMQFQAWKRRLFRQIESYMVAAYTLGPPNMQELQDVLNAMRGDGKNEELEALRKRILNRVQAAAATQPR